MSDRADRWIDFGERVGWTAIQAAAAAVITVLTTGVDWQEGLLFVGIAVLAAAAKVVLAYRMDPADLGAIPFGSKRVTTDEPTTDGEPAPVSTSKKARTSRRRK